MPELPEVETIRRQLGPELLGREIVDAGSHPSDKFTPARLTVGCRFVGHDRRGKYLLFSLDDGSELVVHLGMTGRLAIEQPAGADDHHEARPIHQRAWWNLDNGLELTFTDVRRFGRLRVVTAGDYRDIPTLHKAGPEPWDPDLTPTRFHQLLSRSSRPIKTRLLSQQPIAGVGNIYADEALWEARINPIARRLSPTRAAALLAALRQVLQQGIDNGGTTLRDYRDGRGESGSNQRALAVYGQAGSPCPRCATELRARTIDARTTTWCPVCQAA
jgi:formamidopyrimidine-DNA glycosylase